MKYTFKIMTICILTILISCSTMKQNISKNQKKTLEEIGSLFEMNGNAFYLNSTYSTFSIVWTYKEGKIIVYKLMNGKLKRQEEYDTKDASIVLFNSKKEIFELDKCMELDGDMFGYKIENGSEIDKQDLAINMKCFTKRKYQSEFLNKVVEDINTYKIWDVAKN
jgi:hypothetical protein